MVPSGPPTPIGGAQPVNPSLLRSNSGMLGGQGGSMPSQGNFPSLVSPRNHQFNNNVNLLGNVPNVPSLLNQSFGNGGGNPGMPGSESDSLSGIGNGMGFNGPSSLGGSNIMNMNPSTSGQVQAQHYPSSSNNNQILPDQQQSQQLDPQNSQQFQAGGLGGVPVKLEPHVSGDQNGPTQQQLRGLSQVKLEPQNMRAVGPVKMEAQAQHPDQSMLIQQQQLLQHMTRPNAQVGPAAQMNILQQQRLLQLQQQQLLKGMPPQQRSQLQQQFGPQNLAIRSTVKPVYEPGMCARRLTHYMYQQQHRPEDNNIDFWRKFVSDYFAPNAKKKWCVSMYGSGRQTGVFPQDVWHCEICKRKPGRGFEATVEVLPRLFKIKYESGTLEELLYVDMPREYQNSAGQIVLDYAKAIQESVFDQLRVVRDGQLRIVFSPDLKICSWEFCARRHEELIPRRLLIPQVSQLSSAAQKYQASTQNSSSNMSVSDLQSNCNMFVASARQLTKTLEVPLVNDLGYTKRYVRCLQISEVVNSMKDLIDYSRSTGTGPMESLAKFPRRTSTQSALQGQNPPPEEQQQPSQPPPPPPQQPPMIPNSNNDQNSSQTGVMQIASSNGVTNVNNNSLNVPLTPSTSQSTLAGLLHQSSMNARQQNPMTNASSPYGGGGGFGGGGGGGSGGGGSSLQMPSPGSSATMQQTHPNPNPNPSPFQSPTPSSSNNPPQTSNNHMNVVNSPSMSNIHQPVPSGEADRNDTQSSVQKIIQEMMMNNQLNGGMMGGNPGLNGIVGNGSLGGMGGGIGQVSIVNGIRGGLGNNSVLMNGRVGMASMARDQNVNHQQDMGNQMLTGLGTVNGFSSLHYDWKPSP